MVSASLISALAASLCLWATLSTAEAGWVDKWGDQVNLTMFLKDKNVTYNINDAVSILSDPGFNKALPTVLYMHGYTESNQSQSVALVSDAFLKRGDYNFILIDWNHYVTFPYVKAFFNLFQVSHKIAKSIKQMVHAGLRRETIWVVSHSLGGQLAGVVAKDLDFKLPRITALDPALPGFTFEDIPNLTAEDAEFVDVIHTDAGFFGFGAPDGHINFWPNTGSRVQPGCPKYLGRLSDGFCSHHRSWYYFAESLLNETAFPAVQCASWSEFTKEHCQKKDVVYLGIRAVEARNKQGDYYLVTNAATPFGKGMDGIVDVKKKGSFLSGLISTQSAELPVSMDQKPLPENWGWADL